MSTLMRPAVSSAPRYGQTLVEARLVKGQNGILVKR